MEEAEDDGAGHSEDEHERALAEEPLADLSFRPFEGVVETAALRGGEEGEEEAVGVFAFEHEIDAEKGGGEDVEEVGEPVWNRGEEIAGGDVEGPGGALGDGVDTELVSEGNFLDLRDHLRDAFGKLGGEVAEVAQNRGKAGGEEECQDQRDRDDQEDDGYGARGVVAAKAALRDPGDGWHENDSEESADVEDQQLLLEGPGETEEKKDEDGEEDVAADGGAGSLFVRGEVFGRGVGQPNSPECC